MDALPKSHTGLFQGLKSDVLKQSTDVASQAHAPADLLKELHAHAPANVLKGLQAHAPADVLKGLQAHAPADLLNKLQAHVSAEILKGQSTGQTVVEFFTAGSLLDVLNWTVAQSWAAAVTVARVLASPRVPAA